MKYARLTMMAVATSLLCGAAALAFGPSAPRPDVCPAEAPTVLRVFV